MVAVSGDIAVKSMWGGEGTLPQNQDNGDGLIGRGMSDYLLENNKELRSS